MSERNADLNALAAIVQEHASEFVPLTERYGIAQAILDSDWMAEFKAAARDAQRMEDSNAIEKAWGKYHDVLDAQPARDAAAGRKALEDAADAWPVMTRDMVSRGFVRQWLRARAAVAAADPRTEWRHVASGVALAANPADTTPDDGEAHHCDTGGFDRTLCACGVMHSYCATCGKCQDRCEALR